MTEGQLKYTCQDCGIFYADAISKLPEHTFVGDFCECGYIKPASIVANEDNERQEFVQYLFDGDIKSQGIFGDGSDHVWYGDVNDYVLLTFDNEITLTEMAIYVTGNWTWANVEFIDANGEVIHFVTGDSYDHRIVANENPQGPEGVRKVVFQQGDADATGTPLEALVGVKQIKIVVDCLKWSGKQRTYTLSEIEIFALPMSTDAE